MELFKLPRERKNDGKQVHSCRIETMPDARRQPLTDRGAGRGKARIRVLTYNTRRSGYSRLLGTTASPLVNEKNVARILESAVDLLYRVRNRRSLHKSERAAGERKTTDAEKDARRGNSE